VICFQYSAEAGGSVELPTATDQDQCQQVADGMWVGGSADPSTAILGDDIFDALDGAPGTYLNVDSDGNLSFGFSDAAWHSYYAAITEYQYKFTGGDGSVHEQQKQLAAIQLGQTAFPSISSTSPVSVQLADYTGVTNETSVNSAKVPRCDQR
jgi:hypothetical protein